MIKTPQGMPIFLWQCQVSANDTTEESELLTLFSYIGAYFQIELCHMKRAKICVRFAPAADAMPTASLRSVLAAKLHAKKERTTRTCKIMIS